MIRIYKPRDLNPIEKLLRQYVRENPSLEIERRREEEVIIYEIKKKTEV
jgi:hypothetical protein